MATKFFDEIRPAHPDIFLHNENKERVHLPSYADFLTKLVIKTLLNGDKAQTQN
jgi:hypothetical protein